MIPFSVYLDIGGKEAKLIGQWLGLLATDVEYDIREYSLTDNDINDDNFDFEEYSQDLQTCQSDNRTSHTNLMRELKMKNRAMIENSELKIGLEKAEKQICEQKSEIERLRRFNPCLEKPCMNGGQCIPEGGVQFKCVCFNGFKGEKCEVGYFLFRSCYHRVLC